MGNLAHSADVRASRVEVGVPSMIKCAIEAALAPIQDQLKEQHASVTAYELRLDTLTARVEAHEKNEGNSSKLTSLKDDIVSLRKDVDQFKSIDITSLWGNVVAPEGHVTEIPPATMTRDVGATINAETPGDIEAETLESDEEALGSGEAQGDDVDPCND